MLTCENECLGILTSISVFFFFRLLIPGEETPGRTNSLYNLLQTISVLQKKKYIYIYIYI